MDSDIFYVLSIDVVQAVQISWILFCNITFDRKHSGQILLAENLTFIVHLVHVISWEHIILVISYLILKR